MLENQLFASSPITSSFSWRNSASKQFTDQRAWGNERKRQWNKSHPRFNEWAGTEQSVVDFSDQVTWRVFKRKRDTSTIVSRSEVTTVVKVVSIGGWNWSKLQRKAVERVKLRKISVEFGLKVTLNWDRVDWEEYFGRRFEYGDKGAIE